MPWGNRTPSADFILQGIFDHSPAHTFLFSLVLGVFSAAVLGNSAMLLLICADARLHTPMYSLLGQLSLMDLMLVCTTVPKAAATYLSGSKAISRAGCGAQIFFYVSLLGAECFLLAAMAYDRYVAVCRPLRYAALLRPGVCARMAAACWGLGALDGAVEAAVALSFSYCGSREVPHFFCDVPALLTLACSDTATFERLVFACCVLMLLLPVAVIGASYARVIQAVVRMGSGESRRKAFATCSSHLAVVALYYGAAMFVYMRPTSGRSAAQDRAVSAFYTILTPLLNPLIYSLRNRDVARALGKVLGARQSGG